MPKFKTPDGTNLYFSDEGTGKPVLCLAGLTRNGGDFNFAAPRLPNARIIRLDYRGRGQSDWADPTSYTVPQEAADALALLDHLGLEQAAVLGTSRGGLIAMFLAATAKTRLTGVALNDIGPEIAASGLALIKEYIGKNPSQKTYAEAALARAKFMTDFEGVPASRWREEVELLFEETPDGLINRYDPALAEAFRAVEDQPTPDLWPLFDAMAGLPLAVIRGANSNLFSAETFAEMFKRRPDLIDATVPGRGHVPFLDERESLLALNTWIGELP